MKKFSLKIMSKEKTITREVQEVVVNANEGYLTILKNHIPLISTLRDGKIHWRDESELREDLLIKNGLMKVTRDEVIIFCDIVN